MTARTGLAERLISWVAENPGKKAPELGARFGFNHSSGLLSYLLRSELLFVAGPRRNHHFYATKSEAEAAHARICQEVSEASQHRREVAARESTLRRRGRRHAAGKKSLNVVSFATGHTSLGPGVTLHPDVRIVVAKTPPERFAPEPGFVKVITGDWMLRRQGVESPEAA